MLRTSLQLLFVVVGRAQSPGGTPLDSRLSIHTIMPEDIFAGFVGNDMERFARGEKKLEVLLTERRRLTRNSWPGRAALSCIVRSVRRKRDDAQCEKHYSRAVSLCGRSKPQPLKICGSFKGRITSGFGAVGRAYRPGC